ncbi:DUF5134 domain-containing protein [Streptomyces sp. NBC_00249]|uniref:DUF5134 domain-containing protein n=1 Tax=Streptomyces sp. NBC_00249 TaxID=2975690 RepID=UPI0022504FF8|nr:DUF5134 domain-containing protein [Streptomyces sp. NBC_00249]MCX5197247.1 DUF5134 domain-containing protein [Streptomyces sp. NBC_00249]
MHGPATPLFSASAVSAWLIVLLCAVSGTYCLLRARRADRSARGPAVGEAVMGLGTAAMAVPSGTGAWGPPVLLAVFCGAAVHALWLLRGGAHHAHHLVGSLAMAYMAYLALAVAGGHGHGGAGPSAVTGALLVYYAGYVLLGGARLVTAGGAVLAPAGTGTALDGTGSGPSGAGELTRACRLAMGTGMLAMLLSM